MGISPIDVNKQNDYWNLYARNGQVRQPVQPQFGIGQPPQGTTGTAGFQARETGFDWRNLDKFDIGLTGVQQQPVAETIPSVEAAPVNPFANAKPVSEVAPAATIAQGGNQELQSKLAGLGTGELNPNVNGDQLRHLAWA